MNWIAAGLASLVFLLILQATHILEAGARALSASREGAAALSDPKIDDDGKEAAARKAAIALFKGGLGLALRGGLALVVPGLILFAADRLGVIRQSAVYAIFLRWEMWVASAVLFALALVLRRRR